MGGKNPHILEQCKKKRVCVCLIWNKLLEKNLKHLTRHTHTEYKQIHMHTICIHTNICLIGLNHFFDHDVAIAFSLQPFVNVIHPEIYLLL